MKARVYLVFNARGFVRAAKGGPRYHESPPPLESGERAVRLEVEVPDAAFKPQGAIQASVVVPEQALIEPHIEVEVTGCGHATGNPAGVCIFCRPTFKAAGIERGGAA